MGLRLQLRKHQAEAGDIVLLYGDESEALTHPYLARAWAKSGADLRVPAPGQAKKVAMLGSLDHVTRQLIVHTSPTKRSSDFIAHLEQLDRLYGPQPGRQAKPVVLVEDNGPIHVSKRSLAALAARAHWLTVEWLPKYAPELNEIEPVWRDLKAHHLAHQTFTDVAALDQAIHDAVIDLNRERTLDPLAKPANLCLASALLLPSLYPPFPHCPRHGVSGTGVSGGLPSAQAKMFPTTHSAIARRVLTEAEPTWGRSTALSQRDKRLGDVRLVVVDVEAGGQDLAGPQRLDQRGLVDERAARDIDEYAVRPQRLQHLGVDDMARPGAAGSDDDENVRQPWPSRRAKDSSGRRRRPGLAAVVDDVEPEAADPGRDRLADAPEPENSDRSASQRRGEREGALRRHCPARRYRSACGSWRTAMIMRPSAVSATSSSSTPGVLVAMTPSRAAALASILS